VPEKERGSGGEFWVGNQKEKTQYQGKRTRYTYPSNAKDPGKATGKMHGFWEADRSFGERGRGKIRNWQTSMARQEHMGGGTGVFKFSIAESDILCTLGKGIRWENLTQDLHQIQG